MQGIESYFSSVAYCPMGITKKKAISVQHECYARIMLKTLWEKGRLTSLEKGKMGKALKGGNIFMSLEEWIG